MHKLLLIMILATMPAWGDEGDTGLGYASGLGGEVPNEAIVLPRAPAVNIPSGVRPVIVLPPESLQGHTLLVPLPDEGSPPVVLRRDSIQVAPSINPALPQSRINNGKPKPAGTNGSTVKTTPLDPIGY